MRATASPQATALGPEPIRFVTSDDQTLHGTFQAPPAPRAAVLIAGAMGVHHRYYNAFGAYLAERGFAVLTFDYRGIGASREAADPTVHAWGERDLPAAYAALRARAPGLRVGVVCHSVGGQLQGLLPDRDVVDAALMIASQMGHWRLWDGWRRWAMWATWHLFIPVTVATLGHVPMKRLGMGENLPAAVGREWARWGRHPDYVLSYAREHGKLDGYRHFDRPLRLVAISDDGYAPPRTVEALYERYGSPAKEFKVVTPAQVGAREIGHFGFFRPMFRETLWADCADWLSATLARV